MKKVEVKKQAVNHSASKTTKPSGSHPKPAAAKNTKDRESKAVEKKNEEPSKKVSVAEEQESTNENKVEDKKETLEQNEQSKTSIRPASSKKSEASSLQLIEKNLKDLIDSVYDFNVKDRENFKSEKWPLVIDNEKGSLSSFLKHRDANYIDCLESDAIQAEKFRTTLLYALKNGRALVIDLKDADTNLFDSVKKAFSEINTNVFDDLMSKKLLENEQIIQLIKPDIDGENFQSFHFVPESVQNFKLVFLTTSPAPNPDLASLTTSYKLVP